MPAAAVAIVGLLASTAVTAAFGTGLVATFAAGLVGLVVSTGLSMLLNRAPKVASVEIQAADRKQAVRSGIAPRNIVYGRALIAGPIIYMASSGTYSEYMHIVMPLAGHPIDGVLAVLLNGYRIPTAAYTAGADGSTGSGVGSVAGHMARIYVRIPAGSTPGEIASADISTSAYPTTDLKRDAQVRINIYDGNQTAAPADLLTDMASDWDSDMMLTGLPFIHMTVRYSNEVFPGGFQSTSVEMRGKQLYDPRIDDSEYSDNAVLAALDYLMSDYGLGIPSSEIDMAAVAAAANIADEAVALDVGATVFQARYTVNGSYKLDQTPIDIMEALLTGWGVCTYVQGLYRLHAAASEASTLSLTESDFVDTIQVVRNHPRRDQFNAVSGTYIDPDQNWEPIAFPKVISTTFGTEDGEEISVAFDLPFQISAAAAQRLARLRLLTHRAGGFQIHAALKYSAIQTAIWDTVDVSIAEFGLDEDLFRLTRWQFDPVAGLVNVVLQYDDPNAYAWTATDAAEPILSDPTDLASPLSLPAGETPTVATGHRILTDGTIVPLLLVSWTESQPNPFVTGVEVQWRNHTQDTTWISRVVPATQDDTIIEPIVSADSYKIRLRFLAGTVRGAWSTEVTQTGEATELATPTGPSGTAVTAILGGYRVTFTKATAGDIHATEVAEQLSPFTPVAPSYVGETTGDTFVRMAASGDYATRDVYLRSRNTAGQRSAWALVDDVTPQVSATVDLAANSVTEIDSAVFAATEAPVGSGWEGTAASVNLTVATGEKIVIVWRARLEDYDGAVFSGGGAEGGQDPGA